MTETHALIQCDSAEIPTELEAQAWTYRGPLTSWGDEADLNLRTQPCYRASPTKQQISCASRHTFTPRTNSCPVEATPMSTVASGEGR